MDDIRVLHAKCGWAPMPRIPDDPQMWSQIQAISTFDVGDLDSTLPKANVSDDPTPRNFRCVCCNSIEFEINSDGDAYSCKKCGVVGQRVMKALNRQKNCAQEEDKTVVGDQPREQRDRFAEPALTAEEARKEREREAFGCPISKRTKKVLNLGYVQEGITRQAAVAARNRKKMSTADQTKEQRILLKLEELMKKLYPIHKDVMKHLRISTYQVWQRAVMHSEACTDVSRCMVCIKSKSAAIIAESCMVCALQRLLQGDVVLDGVEHSHILVLNNRLNGDQDICMGSVPQRTVRTQVDRLLAHDDETGVMPICEPTSTPSSVASSPHSSKQCVALINREDSLMTDLDESETTEILELRNALGSIHSLLSDVKVSIKGYTVAALGVSAFRKEIFETRANCENSVLYNINLKALAYVMLCAFAEECADREGFEFKPRKRTKLLQSLNIDQRRADFCIRFVRDIIPPEVFTPCADSRDGLF